MNQDTLNTVARTTAIVIVIVAAAALGLFTGDALRDRDDSPLSAGNAAGPVARTADVSFSLEAISAVAAIRDTTASTGAAEAEDYPDYALRHGTAAQTAPKSQSGATLE
jgi:hypothetical protein